MLLFTLPSGGVTLEPEPVFEDADALYDARRVNRLQAEGLRRRDPRGGGGGGGGGQAASGEAGASLVGAAGGGRARGVSVAVDGDHMQQWAKASDELLLSPAGHLPLTSPTTSKLTPVPSRLPFENEEEEEEMLRAHAHVYARCGVDPQAQKAAFDRSTCYVLS